VLPLWLLSPEYVAVIVSVPTGRRVADEVVQVATPGLPEVTVVVPQPVFVLQVTEPVTTCRFAPALRALPLTLPFSPLMVAVKMSD
jgi:hypothetical protein